MATNYPGGLDSYTTKNTTDDLAVVDHAAAHNDLQDAIEAIEGELGLDPAGAAATVVLRLNGVSDVTSGAGAPGTTPSKVGDIYIDTTADTIYISTDTVSSADWDLLGSGSLSAVVEDTTPQLGGNLDANSNTITGLDASATASGIVELATIAEIDTGTDTTRAITPAGLAGSALQTTADAAATTSTRLDEFAVPTANVDINDQALLQVGPVEERVNTVATSGATETLDVAEYGVHDITMDQNCTFTFSNPAASGEASSFTLILRGAFTPTFPASVDWPDATAPTYTTPTVFVFTTVDAGTTWLGFSPGKAIA